MTDASKSYFIILTSQDLTSEEQQASLFDLLHHKITHLKLIN